LPLLVLHPAIQINPRITAHQPTSEVMPGIHSAIDYFTNEHELLSIEHL
jgi:hypothetical protein